MTRPGVGVDVTLNCANCDAPGRPAFTLAAYPADGGDAVLVDFCSSDCLADWTAEEDEGVRVALEQRVN
jgi:hypothetical protein